jgi:hypothetical protein
VPVAASGYDVVVSAPAIVILMLLLIAAIVGTTLVVGAPYLALPIVFLALVVWGGARVGTARGRRLALDDEDDERIVFTEEDRRTLTPASATPPGRPGSETAG